jgi:5'-3' exonuclease
VELAPLFHAAPILLQALGINLFMTPGYEADDVMATLGKWSHARCSIMLWSTADVTTIVEGSTSFTFLMTKICCN